MARAEKDQPVRRRWARVVVWILVVAVTTLPLLLLGTYSYRVAAHSIENQVGRNNRAAAVMTAELVRSDLEQDVQTAEALASSPAFVDAVRRHDVEGVRAQLKAMQQSFSDLDRAYVTDREGTEWSDYPPAPESLGKNFAHLNWYQQMFPAGKACVSAVYRRNAEPRPLVVAAAAPIRSDGQVIGAVVLQSRVEGLSQWLKQVEVGDGGYVYVVDYLGGLAAHPRVNLREKRFEEYANAAPVLEARRGNGLTVVYEDALSGTKMLASGVAIELRGQKWVVVAQQDYRHAMTPVRNIGISIGLATLLLAGGLLVAGVRVRRAQEREQKWFAQLADRNAKLDALSHELEAAAHAERQARVQVEQTLRELQETQLNLVRSEKLASLGQLVAGMAHELNNPLAFVMNNIAVLRRDFGQMRELLELYQQASAAPAEGQKLLNERLQGMAQEMDLAYVLGHLDEVLARSKEGLRRIGQIVKDLREFSRQEAIGDVDSAVDLNVGIRSTLVILQGRATAMKINLGSQLGPLPPITCQPAKMNQVVLNLLTNAMDACEARFGEQGGGEIRVESKEMEDGVEMSISDNGCGISGELLAKVFDPFFTTKPLGKGTGLGLSITHGIVMEHGGRIEVKSEVGEGSRFSVWLPRVPPAGIRKVDAALKMS